MQIDRDTIRRLRDSLPLYRDDGEDDYLPTIVKVGSEFRLNLAPRRDGFHVYSSDDGIPVLQHSSGLDAELRHCTFIIRSATVAELVKNAEGT